MDGRAIVARPNRQGARRLPDSETVSTVLPSLSDSVAVASAAAGVRSLVHARDLRSGAEVGVDADAPVVLASVFKVPVAVELVRRFAAGDPQPTERVRVPASRRTMGPTGLSALVDDVEMSWRDLAQLMLSVSDNTATDVILERLGAGAVNRTMRALGLRDTVVERDCEALLGRLVEDLQLDDAEQARLAAGDESLFEEFGPERWMRCRDLQPATTNHSTPREMTRLLELVWKDEAAPAEGCALVRRIMGQQVWPHRLRSGFPGTFRTSGKTGTLPFVRNEVGVVESRDGAWAVAVFTVAERVTMMQPDADRVIGTVARLAVDALRGV